MLTSCSTDVYVASVNSTCPVYASAQRAQNLVIGGKHIPDDYAIELSKIMGSGLGVLAEIDIKLLEVYLLARDLTIALDQFHRSAEGRPSLPDLVDARNKTQHDLCSLRPRVSTETNTGSAWYEVVRLAGLIFADMVILPLPYKSGVKPRLSRQLRHILEIGDLITPRNETEYHGLLTWAVSLGAIAATLTRDYGWYLQKLRELNEGWKMDWFRYKGLMRTFLWWDFVLEVPAARMWKEMYA